MSSSGAKRLRLERSNSLIANAPRQLILSFEVSLKKLRNILVGLLILSLLLGLWWAHTHVPFDWANLRQQLHSVSWKLLLAGIAAIHLSITLRAWRWQLLLGREGKGSSAARLIGSQFVGFTTVALFGRVADLTRPYMLARKTQTPVGTQLAIYSLERAFDLAAAAILFSTTLLFVPRDLPHHHEFVRAGAAAMTLTLIIVIFSLLVRFSGGALASIARTAFRFVSQEFANNVAEKILDFRQGMMTINSWPQMLGCLLWSLLIWSLIASAYWTTARSFVLTPELAHFTVSMTMLLMATSMGASLLQLPIVGWFTQIGALALALHAFFQVPVEVASAAGALLLLVTTLSIVPAGAIAARVEGVSLRAAARKSEEATDALLEQAPPPEETIQPEAEDSSRP